MVDGNKAVLEKLSQGLSILKTPDNTTTSIKSGLVPLEPPGFSLSTVLKYIGGIILGFMAIGSVLILWSFSLKRQVTSRTSALEQEMVEHRQAEEALRKSEEKYRSILESIEDGYYEVDMDGNFTFFNDSLCRIYGYPTEELMKINIRTATEQNAEKRGIRFSKGLPHRTRRKRV